MGETDPDRELQQTPFNVEQYDPEQGRERIRGAVTLFVTAVFAGVVAIYLYGAFAISNDTQWGRLKEALAIILPAVTSVLGSALGFYFGSQKR